MKTKTLLILGAVVLAVLYFNKRGAATASPSGSAADPVSKVIGGVNATIGDLSAFWSKFRGDLGFTA